MIKKIASTFTLAILYACATVQSPTGGEKDEKAPILYQSTPEDQSTNFDDTEIKLFFNEWMKLEQLNKELIITPREDIEYEATLKKQELTITLTKPLQDSTTYTFNFRKALSDITEGNLWQNPKIAFSTGDYLDSLRIQGKVIQLMTQEPAKNFLVGLYNANVDTANLRQGKPIYFTTTDTEGKFSMDNLKTGSYLLYTFNDENDNLINNSQSEPFGFHTSRINLMDSIPPITLTTYKRNEDTLKLKKYSPVGKDFIVQYNKGISNYTITNSIDSTMHIYANDVEQSKYLKIYKENFPELPFETDSLQLYIQVEDSIGNTRTDTVQFKTRESRLTNDPIKIVKTPEPTIITGPQHFTYQLSKPVRYINYDSIQLRLDTVPIQTITPRQIQVDSNKKYITLNFTIDQSHITKIADSLATVKTQMKKEQDSLKNQESNVDQKRKQLENTTKDKSANEQNINSTEVMAEQSADQETPTSSTSQNTGSNSQNNKNLKLNLYIGHSAFVGIELDSTKSSSTNLTFKEIENYGIIKGEIINIDSDFIIELLTEQYESRDTLINVNSYQFNYVKPGTYRLRLVEDTNGNHQWDAGNPFTLEPAENIYYLDEVITVKANWEILDKNFDLHVDKAVDSGGEK